MISAARTVSSELLDELDPDDPRARHSRLDLRRVHRAMGSLSILNAAIAKLQLARRPMRILELGAGDASLLLRVARARRNWRGVELTALDRHDLPSLETRKAYSQLGWNLTVLRAEAISWATEQHSCHFDLCITTLFLHHFELGPLHTLMAGVAACTDAFIACEPRRNIIGWLGGQLVGLLGANAVTRNDAVKSVEAGFTGQELSAIWPNSQADWHCQEYAARPFIHCFAAARAGARHG